MGVGLGEGPAADWGRGVSWAGDDHVVLEWIACFGGGEEFTVI